MIQIIKHLLERKGFLFFIAISWTLLITMLSLFSFTPVNAVGSFAGMDKIAHFTFYFLFVVFWWLYIRLLSFFLVKKQRLRVLAVVSLLYGMLIEVLQYYMNTNRTADVYDVLANAIGVFFGVLVIYRFIFNIKAGKKQG